MRFYFDIDDGIFEDEFGVDFKETVKAEAINTIANDIFSRAIGDSYYSDCGRMISQIIKDNTSVIIDRVVEKVAEQILRKKAIIELTPKASEVAAMNKDNIMYFEEMIDKAIARKFKK